MENEHKTLWIVNSYEKNNEDEEKQFSHYFLLSFIIIMMILTRRTFIICIHRRLLVLLFGRDGTNIRHDFICNAMHSIKLHPVLMKRDNVYRPTDRHQCYSQFQRAMLPLFAYFKPTPKEKSVRPFIVHHSGQRKIRNRN